MLKGLHHNAYVIELTAKRPDHDQKLAAAAQSARQALNAWQRSKTAT